MTQQEQQQQQIFPWESPFPLPIQKVESLIVAVLGAQWGDEGKGKLVDVLAAQSNVCCRFNGGSNAGHTLVVSGVQYGLHLIPCGILYPHVMNLLGNGVVVHLKTLLEELDRLEKLNSKASERVLISSRAHLVFDFHQCVDGHQETDRLIMGTCPIGTTKRGIGPCYSSKMARTGVRVCDLLDPDIFEAKYRSLCAGYQKLYGFQHDCDEEVARHHKYRERIRPLVVDGVGWIHEQIRQRKKILVEGANATFLDIDFGTYPFVTSSSTIAGGICTGLGIPPALIRQVIGVVKAYTTRVGEGPFPTELHDAEGDILRHNGHEFGTTTGRPRRCGWLDTPMVRYSNAICGFAAVNLTKLDVLTGLPKLKLCSAYRRRSTGEIVATLEIPISPEAYDALEPVYEELPGWTEKIGDCKRMEDLPLAAQRYIGEVEKLICCSIAWIGVGPERHQMIFREPTRSLSWLAN